MYFHNQRIRGIRFLMGLKPVSIGLCCLLLNTHAIADIPSSFENNAYAPILDQFSAENLDPETLKQFDAYLINATGYPNDRYLQGLMDLLRLYLKSIARLSDCDAVSKEIGGNNTSQWLNDFTRTFGKKAIADNQKALSNHLFSLGIKQSKSHCREKQAECILMESYFLRTLKEYLRLFLDFEHSLKTHDKTAQLKTNVDHFLSEFHFPIREITVPENIHLSLSAFGLQYTPDLPKEMIDFFNTHPHFSEPFDSFKAIKDLTHEK